MTTFVLVHGAWAGAHGWRAVRKLLAAEGHDVFTPSLTGIGERVHLASPQIDLTTHVNDVVNQIVFEDLREIVLVGYSYGGVVVTAAAEHVHDRIAELVYLDAFVPSDGDSAFDAARCRRPDTDRTRRRLARTATGPGLRRPGGSDVAAGTSGRSSRAVLHGTGPSRTTARGV